MSLPKLVIIADDLTGAADSAARCVQAGLSAEIWLEPSAQDTKSAVVALSTDSRFLPAEEARQRVTDTLAELSSWSGTTWYKKIDSTLRGNIGAEIDAMLAALPNTVAVICPSFPAQGRGLEEGKLRYQGAPELHLPTLLRQQSTSAVSEIGLPSVSEGVDALTRALDACQKQGAKLIVVDGMTEDDMEIIVTATQSGGYLLCGNAGMVAPLAARWRQRRGDLAQAQLQAGPILAIVGSGSKVAHAQVAEVAAAQTMQVRELNNNWYEMDLIGAQSHPVGDWLIHNALPDDGLVLEGATARAQAARLADVTLAAYQNLQPTTLLIVGGDSAYFVLRRLGIKRLTVVEELLPGIALTFGVDEAGHQRVVILKPGNFGDAQTLLTLQRAIQQRHH